MKKLSFVFLGLFLLSCNLIDPPSEVQPDEIKDVAEMNQSFGWDIFQKEVESEPNKNVLISPLSIQTALSMAINGAGGKTLEEMQEVLHCNPCDLAALNTQQQKLMLSLTRQSGHPEIRIANAFFYDPNRMLLKESFEQVLTDYYDCVFKKDDFNNEQKALNNINNWVSNSTKGKIDKILEEIGSLDVAFLINALYFKSDWAKGFAPELSHEAPFNLKNGATVPVMFVSGDRDLHHAKTADFEMVDIPFRDSTFSLSLIQTTGTGSLSDLNRETYDMLLEKLNYDRLFLSFPRLKLSFDNDLIASLRLLGMQAAFEGSKADFKAMGTASNNIYISQIRHKAVLEVDEKGAEGAAVTSIGFSNTSMPESMLFNKPFVLVLRHIETNTILFIGYVRNPKLT